MIRFQCGASAAADATQEAIREISVIRGHNPSVAAESRLEHVRDIRDIRGSDLPNFPA